jgi:hypothetical protein
MRHRACSKFVSHARLLDRAAGRAGAVPLARRFVLVWRFELKRMLPSPKASSTAVATGVARRRVARKSSGRN